MTDADRKDMERFHNRLRILRSIDSWDFPSVSPSFHVDPYSFFVRCSDAQRDDLWRIIREREGS